MPSDKEREISNICDYIKEGWYRSFKFQWEATGCFFKEIKPEQIISVNIAISIVDKQKYFGHPFILKLEEKTSVAFNECFEPIKKFPKNEKYKFTKIERKIHNSSRDGKFDIVIYNKSINSRKQHDTRYVIEVKGFNQRRCNILTDIKRIHELASLSDNVGSSSFVAGFVTFAKSYNISVNYKDKHLKWLYSLIHFGNFDIRPIIFDISTHTPSGDHDIDHAHSFIGTILIVKGSV